MKYKRVGYFLIVILALLVLLFPLPARAADKFINLQPDRGKVGDWVGVNVFYFDAPKLVDIYFSSDKANVDNTIGGKVTAYQHVIEASTVGSAFGGTFIYMYFFTVPDRLTDGERKEDVHNGKYYIYATYRPSTSIVCGAEFTVLDGEIEVNPEEGAVGSEVEVSGEDLRQNQKVSLEYDGGKVDIIRGDSETDGKGHFLCTIIIPESVTGSHTIAAHDESGDSDEAEFSVKPEITLDSGEQGIGGVVVASGTGFPENEAMTLTVGGHKVDTTPPSLVTDSLGSFNCSFVVPFFDSTGPRNVGADDSEGTRLADVSLSILAGIVLSQTSPASPGYVGMEVTVHGIGFASGADVIVSYAVNDDEAITVAEAKADENGKLSAGFTVPPSAGGSHVVTATDGVVSVSSVFTMESKAPPFPRLLLPEIGTKSPAEAHFDWEDVSDTSGVSYTLQVATDGGFNHIVLEKKGLLQSEYTMGGGEKLAPTKASAPYYWRVRAVDGASNEGDWSPSVLFYVGSSGLSNWLLYVFCGLGVVLLVVIIFWVRRRRARYSPPL